MRRMDRVCARETDMVKNQCPIAAALRARRVVNERGRGGNDDRGEPSQSFTGKNEDSPLAETFGDIARVLQQQDDLQSTLAAIVAAAVHTVPGAQQAGITVAGARGVMTTPAATHEVVRRVDRIQYDTGQGPCVTAIREHATLRLDDMNAESRWPDFAHRAAQLGVRSMLSFQLYVTDTNLGALNLYAEHIAAFDDTSEYIGLLFASHAAVALTGARQRHHLNQQLLMREVIGQAKGILMERHNITADQAFALLVRASQHSNRKLTDLARELAETGLLSIR
jgi:transcriptional regulator with GAF, ATPase, and Fis domain